MKKRFLSEPTWETRTLLVSAMICFSWLVVSLGSVMITKRQEPFLWIGVLTVLAFAMPLVLYLNTEAGRGTLWGNVGFSPRSLWRIALFALGLLLLSFAVLVATGKGMRIYGYSHVLQPTWKSIFPSFLFLVLFPTLSEELFLRGVWQGEQENVSILGTVLLSACLSTVYGMDAFTCLYLFLGGAVLSLVRMQNGSVYASLLCALAWRGVLLLGMPALPLDAIWGIMPRAVWAVIAVLLSAVCFFFAIYKKAIRKSSDSTAVLQKDKLQKMYFPVFSVAALAVATVLSFIFHGRS